MRYVIGIVVVVLTATAAFAQKQPKTVPAPESLMADAEKHQMQSLIWDLQKQIAQLRATLAERDAQIASVSLNAAVPTLQAERTKLEENMKLAVGCADKACTVDWTKSPPVVVWPSKK